MTTETNPLPPAPETARLAASLARIATSTSATRKAAHPGHSKPPPESTKLWRALHLGLDEDHHPKIAELSASCAKFVRSALRDYRSEKSWFVIAGQTGCGKTHAARAVSRYFDAMKVQAWSMGLMGNRSHVSSPVFVQWPTICELDTSFFLDWLRWDVSSAMMVILDDVGAESERYRNGENESRLLRVLEACERKWLMVTTNVRPKDWVQRWDQRIADRLLKAARISLFDVPSYRLRK